MSFNSEVDHECSSALSNTSWEITLHNTLTGLLPEGDLHCPLHPSWHRGWPSVGGGADWSGMAAAEGMRGIPLVNTSCSNGHHRSLISPCQSRSLIIVVVSYSLPAPPPLLLSAFPVASACAGQVGLPLFKAFVYLRPPMVFCWLWYPLTGEHSLLWCYCTTLFKCQRHEREILRSAQSALAPSAPMGTLHIW